MENNNKFILEKLEELGEENKILNTKVVAQDKEIERLNKESERHERKSNVLEQQLIDDRRANNKRFNNQDNRSNNQDARMNDLQDDLNKFRQFTLAELTKLREQVEGIAKATAETLDIEEIAPETNEEEMRQLKSFLEFGDKKKPNPLLESLYKTKEKCLSFIAKTAISSSVSMLRNGKDDNKLRYFRNNRRRNENASYSKRSLLYL